MEESKLDVEVFSKVDRGAECRCTAMMMLVVRMGIMMGLVMVMMMAEHRCTVMMMLVIRMMTMVNRIL